MRRLRRKTRKQGLVEDRRRLVRLYLAEDEAPLPADSPPAAEERGRLPRSARRPTAAVGVTEHVHASGTQPETSAAVAMAMPPAPEPALPAVADVEPHRPVRSRPIGPDTFERAIGTFEEVGRLCEQLGALGDQAECRRETLAAAAARLALLAKTRDT
jgi:hypothetical protein